jgi:hypothetical protein
MTSPLSPNLTLGNYDSVLNGATMREDIDPQDVVELINGDYLSTDWGNSYSENISARLFKNETEQLEKFLKFCYKKKKGYFETKLSKGQRKVNGRVYNHNGLGVCAMRKKIRNTLIHKKYIDLDLSNAQPKIIMDLVRGSGIECPTLQRYCDDREGVFNEINDIAGLTVKQLKNYVIRICFGGTWYGWVADCQKNNSEFIANPEEPPTEGFMYDIAKDIEEICDLLIEKNPDYFKAIKKKCLKENKKNYRGSFLSEILQEHEFRIIDTCFQTMTKETDIVKGNCFIYEYDGFKLLKDRVEEFGKENLIQLLERSVRDTLGYDIKLEEKPIEGFYELPTPESKEEALFKTVEEFENKHQDQFYESIKEEFEKRVFKIIELDSFIYLKYDGGFTLVKKSNLMSMFQNKYYYEMTYTDKGPKLVKKAFIGTWLFDEDVRAYEGIVSYPPDIKYNDDRYYNIWTPFAGEELIRKYEIVNNLFCPAKGVILNHIRRLVGGGETAEYMLSWIAQMIQYPSVKSNCPTLISEEGAGKGSLMRLFGLMLGKSKVFETSSPEDHIWGQFNAVLKDAFLVNLNELSIKQTLQSEGKIKTLITDSQLTINAKCEKPFNIESFHRFFISTNKEEPIKTHKKDRRNWIVRCSDEFVGNVEYFNMIHSILDDERNIAVLYNYFKNEHPDMKDFKSIPKPMGEYQQELVQLSRSVIDEYVMYRSVEQYYYKNKNNEPIEEISSAELFNDFVTWKHNRKITYECSATQFAVRLKRLNISGVDKGKKTNKANYKKLNYELIKNHYQLNDIEFEGNNDDDDDVDVEPEF